MTLITKTYAQLTVVMSPEVAGDVETIAKTLGWSRQKFIRQALKKAIEDFKAGTTK